MAASLCGKSKSVNPVSNCLFKKCFATEFFLDLQSSHRVKRELVAFLNPY